MPQPWDEGVHGTQVPVLINLDAPAIRCVAGPGSGKTFGLVRRVERILHPAGLGVDGRRVLVVAFNRVIARQLREDISARLTTFECPHQPVIRTIHALCVQVIGEDLRMLLPHEVEAMIYDLLHEYPDVAALYEGFDDAAQALRDHDAGHAEHMPLWQAAQQWLVRHKAHLVGDLPRLLLERLKGGDFPEQVYDYVIVDEFQDLTAGEQELMFRLRRPGGQLVALGDPRQSIYKFRGNDSQGLSKIETLAGSAPLDVPIIECQRCPEPIVRAANQLMALSGVDAMVPVSTTAANIHVVTWTTPEAEAAGMATAIVNNIHAHPEDRHLAMVTRRQFGYLLRDSIAVLDPNLRVELGFSEGLLESWAAREAFLLFCLLVDPDPATWRSWLGYRNSQTGAQYNAPTRNADAYLRLLKDAADTITAATIEALAAEPRTKPRGGGGATIWDRAIRFLALRESLKGAIPDPQAFINSVFDPGRWLSPQYEEHRIPGARKDLHLLCEKALLLLRQEQERTAAGEPLQQLQAVVEGLRHQIATNEPLAASEQANLQVTTLWGAKGVTAEHVYILGACREAMPGERRDEYPGTDAEYRDEQRRLFYVSITRAKRTLVVSRALQVNRGMAMQLGLTVSAGGHTAVLGMSPFLHEIMGILPAAVQGAAWNGCGG
jgi:superfamily I DNA/RNA helicase